VNTYITGVAILAISKRPTATFLTVLPQRNWSLGWSWENKPSTVECIAQQNNKSYDL